MTKLHIGAKIETLRKASIPVHAGNTKAPHACTRTDTQNKDPFPTCQRKQVGIQRSPQASTVCKKQKAQSSKIPNGYHRIHAQKKQERKYINT